MVLHLAQHASTAHDSSAAQINAPAVQHGRSCASCCLPLYQVPFPLVPTSLLCPPGLMPAAGGGQDDPFLSQEG